MPTDPCAPAPGELHRALIVDSSPQVNQLLTSLFDPKDWTLCFVPGNKEALAVAEAEFFHLIITGERTSGQEDLELLRRLRLVRPHTRLIILADETAAGDIIASIRERAFSYFSRPFSGDRLAEFIHAAISGPCWDDGIEILSATPNWVRLSARCDVLTANRLIQFYREASELPEAETEEVATAFREILMNAIEYGGKFDPAQYVEVGYVRTKRAIVCRVKDPGEGFSIDELKHSALANPPEDPFQHMSERDAKGLRPGGFGILMARKLVDELIFNEKGNEAVLIKYLDKSETPASS